MSRCIALVHHSRESPSWTPCIREAIPRRLFCAFHRDALDGALLGYYFMLETRHAEKQQREKAPGARKIRRRRKKGLRRKKGAAETSAASLPDDPRSKARPAHSGAAVREPHPPEAAAAPPADVR